MYPYVHGLLLLLLIRQMEHGSVKLSHLHDFALQKLSGKVTMTASLEWMLHVTLCRHDETMILPTQQADGALLQQVIAFLKRFPQCFQVIVNVLRKTDQSYWKRLFDALGSDYEPKQLYKKLISMELIHDAAHMLKILQDTEGIIYACESAYALLEKVLSYVDVCIIIIIYLFVAFSWYYSLRDHARNRSG